MTTTLLAELQRDADDEQMGDLGCLFYLIRRRRLIAYVDITPGLPVQITRYD